MESNQRMEEKLLTVQQTTENPPTSSSTTGMSSMFNNAQNIDITGGSFNVTSVTNNNTVGPSLEILRKRVAPNAILNTGGRADEVRCHPGTRKEVIGHVEKWGDAQGNQTTPMFWLSGPAGAGKSAILQTMAERYDEDKVPHANFFFFRADTSRSNASPLIATLLHQIILLYPSLRDPVATVLSADPLILDSTLANQLAQLIVTPLRTIQQSSSDYRPILLLIDGLDECDSESKHSQHKILHAFDKVLAEHPCPFRLLVASRDESQIRVAFNKLHSQCCHLYLDDQYSPKNDIRVFINAQFEQIRKTHPLAHMLDASWPSVNDVSYIVEKSSGQFIYAATVMRFILDSSASPIVSLQRVQGAARLATKSPFSHLDSIYSYILSQADNQEVLKDILQSQLLITRSEMRSEENFGSEERRRTERGMSGYRQCADTPLMELLSLVNPRYTAAIVYSCLADLTPIARYASHTEHLQFYHASFSDYLLDQSRSADYFVDPAVFTFEILPTVWNCMDKEGNVQLWLEFGLAGLRQLQELPPGLMKILASSERVWSDSGHAPVLECSVFQTMYDLCTCDDDVMNFRRIVHKWINNNHHAIRFHDLDLNEIPFGHRYFQMCRNGSFTREGPDSEMATALCPETDVDRQELALWLNKSLHFVHRNRQSNPRYDLTYRHVLKAWISWAVRNDISCDGLRDLPDAQWYIWRSMVKKRATRHWFSSSKK